MGRFRLDRSGPSAAWTSTVRSWVSNHLSFYQLWELVRPRPDPVQTGPIRSFCMPDDKFEYVSFRSPFPFHSQVVIESDILRKQGDEPVFWAGAGNQ